METQLETKTKKTVGQSKYDARFSRRPYRLQLDYWCGGPPEFRLLGFRVKGAGFGVLSCLAKPWGLGFGVQGNTWLHNPPTQEHESKKLSSSTSQCS